MLHSSRHFSNTFAKPYMDACLKNIESHTSFNLAAMPGVGITFFLRALGQIEPEEFIFINSYEMQEFTRDAFYSQLASKLSTKSNMLYDISAALKKRAETEDRIVIVFNRLDRLVHILDQNFYDNMRFLRDAARDKISMIFVSSVPLVEVSGDDVKELVSLISKTTYFRGYSESDLKEILASRGLSDVDPLAIQMSGGHHLLLQVLMLCQSLKNPLADPMVELVVRDLYTGISIKRRKILAISMSKKAKPLDQYLVDAGYIKHENGSYNPFTPLLANYVSSLGKQYLPLKEKLLFKILLTHQGQLVTKEAIFNYVWSENDGIVSDWALNALVYRLRRHSAFDSQRFSIDSRKSEGYVLYEHS